MKTAILVVHGVGNQNHDYANNFIALVNRRLQRMNCNPQQFVWKSVWWNPVFELKQAQLSRAIFSARKIKYLKLRSLLIQAGNDALTYHARPKSRELVHRCVADAIADLANATGCIEQGDACRVPLVIVAHSLGAYIMCNHIWDVQKGRRTPSTQLESFQTLMTLVTFGCNIPMFTAQVGDVPLRTVRGPQIRTCFPKSVTQSELDAIPSWLNLYDPADLLGFPLRTINDHYRASVDEDRPIRVGSWIPFLDLKSHGQYWTHRSFIDAITNELLKINRLYHGGGLI